jgi:hypothetical protein
MRDSRNHLASEQEPGNLRQQSALRQILAQSGRHHIALVRQMQVEYQACSTAQRALVELRRRAATPETIQKLANRLREHQVLHVLLAKAREANATLQACFMEAVQRGNLPEAQRLQWRLQQQIAQQQASLLH